MAENIETKQANKTLYITLGIIVILVIGLFTNGFGLFNKKNPPVINSYNLDIGNSPAEGSQQAQVTMYEFSDFSCPFCERFASQTSPQINDNYVKTGKLRVVFKYFPGHGAGEAAMIVGYALNDQNPALFWKFYDLAFANQADTGDLVKMKALAAQLGANTTQIDEGISSGKYSSMLTADEQMATRNGVSGTPTFIIGKGIIIGACPYNVFQSAIDAESAGKTWSVDDQCNIKTS